MKPYIVFKVSGIKGHIISDEMKSFAPNDDDLVEKLIDAISDKDHNAIAGLIGKVVDKAVRDKEAEWKKSRPDAAVGNGGFPTMTVEQIMAIPDREERRRAINENIELFS